MKNIRNSYFVIRTSTWFKSIVIFLASSILLNICFPPRLKISYSTIVTDANGTILHTFLSDDDKWRMYATLDEISPTLRKAILFKEDKYFYWHLGFNPVSIVRATVRNAMTGRRTSGASTITMQVVRLLYPQKRTYWNKLTEIFRAVQLEIFYSKDEILQLYLNLVPYGSNIEGIKSASMLYFKKTPDLLSLAELTTLSIIPNRPSSLRLGTRNSLVVQERNKWLKRFQKADLFESQAIENALNEPLSVSRNEAPKNAPHLAIRLKNSFPEQPIIQSSLRANTQAKVEILVKNYVNRIRVMNIQNAAVLVIDNETMNVVSYVGSADFYNNADGGQVDGIQAIRSPGSALKPLLYALAFEKGIITPKSMINDVPTNFNGFEPENFDKRFNGKVSTTFALANSLNIPAVKILRDLGKSSMIDALKKMDFKTIKKQEKDLGLSLILGGCGVTLEEMTQMYAQFANGEFQKMKLSNDKSAPSSLLNDNILSILNPQSTYPFKNSLPIGEGWGGASFLLHQILTQIKRPDLPNNFDYSYRLPKIAWKTGTSFGKRDAWSIGYNKRFTVGVWVGNFSGEGVPELSGAEIATPLLFNIFNAIDYNGTNKAFKQPENINLRKVCAETGNLPNEFCSNQVLDYYISGISHTNKCEHSKNVFVNQAETNSFCTDCLPNEGIKQKLYPNLSPELLAFYESKQVFYERIPPHNPNCERIFKEQDKAPNIISPNDGSEYFIDTKEPQQIQLACQATNDVKIVFWYINDELYAKSSPSKPVFYSPKMGNTKISCSDDKGRNSNISIRVMKE